MSKVFSSETVVFRTGDDGTGSVPGSSGRGGEKNVPVIMDVDLGHLAPMMPIVTGSCAEVQVQGNDVTLRYDYR